MLLYFQYEKKKQIVYKYSMVYPLKGFRFSATSCSRPCKTFPAPPTKSLISSYIQLPICVIIQYLVCLSLCR